jgi:hypothetical protein
VIYATLPEIYVRSSYGGYMAIANFLALSAAYFHLRACGDQGRQHIEPAGSPRTANRLAFGASVLGAIADQKVILVSMAAAGRAVLRVVTSLRSATGLRGASADSVVRGAAAVVVGFGAGWVLYAIYGSSISRWYFYQDHVVGHVMDRMRLQDVNLVTEQVGTFVYPSIVGLWREFAMHTGWLIALPMLVATAWGLRRARQAEGVFALWVLIGAVGFSLVDWRHTKHLAQITPALGVLVGAWWAAQPRRARQLLAVVLTAGVAWNLVRIVRLMNDFTYLQPHPIW